MNLSCPYINSPVQRIKFLPFADPLAFNPDFSTAVLFARGKWGKIFKTLKEMKYNPKILSS